MKKLIIVLALVSSYSLLAEDLKTSTESLTSITDKLKEMEAARTTLNSKIEDLQNDVKRASEAYNTLKKQLEEAKKGHSKEIEELKAQIGAAETVVTKANTKIKEFTTKEESFLETSTQTIDSIMKEAGDIKDTTE